MLLNRRISQIVAFIGTYVLLLYYALRGGSYDVVVRQEEAIAVWWVIGLGWASGALPRFPRPRNALLPLLALAGLVAWTALSLSWSESDSRTLAEVARDLHYAGLVVLVWSLIGRDSWSGAGAGVVAAAVTVCGLAVASRLFPGPFPDHRIGGVFETNRLSYPFNYWNAVAACAAMTAAMVLALSAHVRHVALRAACAVALPLCGLCAYLTYARQGILGMSAAAVVVFALSRNRWTVVVNLLGGAAGAAIAIHAARGQHAIVDATSGAGGGTVLIALLGGCLLAAAVAVAATYVRLDRVRLPKRAAQVAVIGGAVLALGIAATAASGTISRGWDQFKTEGGPGVTSDPAARLSNLHGTRYAHWQSALRAFKAHPLDGTGAGTFEFWSSRDGIREFVRDAHSLYFESLAELGAIGFALVVLVLGGPLFVAMRARHAVADDARLGLHIALTSAFVVFAVHAAVDWVWETTAIATFALIAIAIAGARTAETERLSLRIPARAAVAVVALAAILVQIPNLASTSLMRKSEAAFRAGNVEVAATEANDAVHAAPWSADAYMQRALIFESQDRLREAATDMQHAIEREPFNWRPPLLLSRIEAERGRVGPALKAYRTFKRLRPNSLFKVDKP